MRSFIQRYPAGTYMALVLLAQLTIVLSTWWFIPDGGHMHDDSPGARTAHMIFRMRVFMPIGLAVMFTWYLEGMAGLRKLFGSFFHWKMPAGWYLLAFSWKFIMGYIAIGAVVLFGLDTWPGAVNQNAWSNVLSTIFFGIGIAIVEETSWIRYSVTRLQDRFTALTSATIVGLAWSAWYLMMMLLGEGVPDGIPWYAFIISMFSLSVFLTWAYNTTRSGAILLVMQFFSNNAFVIVPMLPTPDREPYFMNAFVILFLIVAVGMVIRYGKESLSTRARAGWHKDGPEPKRGVASKELAAARSARS